MKRFFKSCRKLLAAVRRRCLRWSSSILNEPEVYRDSWERPDPDDVR
ncbi:MAG: hypothetical protein LUF83_07700 [Alistipes sp.]|nr:hypothetical protein [Alistipes sp.]